MTASVWTHPLADLLTAAMDANLNLLQLDTEYQGRATLYLEVIEQTSARSTLIISTTESGQLVGQQFGQDSEPEDESGDTTGYPDDGPMPDRYAHEDWEEDVEDGPLVLLPIETQTVTDWIERHAHQIAARSRNADEILATLRDRVEVQTILHSAMHGLVSWQRRLHYTEYGGGELVVYRITTEVEMFSIDASTGVREESTIRRTQGIDNRPTRERTETWTPSS